MASTLPNLQPDLFASAPSPIQLSSTQKAQMTQLVKILLIEIVMTPSLQSQKIATTAAEGTEND